jgi:glycosyltransferase involved in cell wall biosynthesis
MRVLICHERFIGRYGADRVLLVLARAFRAGGAHVTLMGARFDADTIADAADAVVMSPFDVAAPELEARTASWVAHEWGAGQAAGRGYDVVVVGGWPFFTAIPSFRAIAPCVLFIDCGVVPEAGYPDPTRWLLRQLVTLRRRFLPACTHVAANSLFTMRSQSIPDAGAAVSCDAVLNGVDHLPDVAPGSVDVPPALIALEARRRPAILLLGRFEPVGYKDSAAAFDVLSAVHDVDPRPALLVLEPHEQLEVPSALRPHVFGIGYPSDAALVEVMRRCALGWSVSQWEGFNLPLAEMFWLERPALAFDLAAHPEVVPNRWFLARDAADMAARSLLVLQGSGAVPVLDGGALADYRCFFTWERFVCEIGDLIGAPAALAAGASRMARA